MLLLLLLLSSISLRVASQKGKTAADCTVGTKWTDSYIRSECFQGAGVKGVRAIGCVPSNHEQGPLFHPGETSNDKWFKYRCSKSGDIISYKIINCRDSDGKELAVGKNRTMADGSKYRCYKDQSGAIKLAQESSDGCLYDGVKYTAGKTWTEPTEFKVTIAGVSKLIGKGIRMECKKEGAAFAGVVAGCITASGKPLYNGKFLTENNMNIKCLIAPNGTVTMTVVDHRDLTCTLDKVEVKNGEKYTTPDGIDVYICVFGIMKKISCIIDGNPYGADTLVDLNNKKIYCNKGPGYVDFGSITGCTLPDGTVKPFYSSWVVGTEVHRCYFSIKKNIVTAYGAFWRCSFNGQTIPKFTIATDGKTYFKKCVGLGKTYGMRDLSAAEITAYLNARKQGGSSSEFGGSGGEAGGETISQNPSIKNDTEGCPSLPRKVPANQFPAQWIKGSDLVVTNYGKFDLIVCPDYGSVGQLGPGSKSFTFGDAYRCYPATEKWIHPSDNYEAPAFVSCGKLPKGTHNKYCSIVHQQSNGAQGEIAIYPGNEQICPIGQTLQFADGRVIRNIECSGAGLKIVDGDGNVTRPGPDQSPRLICVPGKP